MDLPDSIRGLISEVTERYGVELVDLAVLPGGRRRVLRLYIDQPGGITHEDCVFVSRKVGEILDQKDAVPFPYDLEVSSPGINRPLTRIQHFERFRGEPAEVELKLPREGRRHFTGRIEAVEGTRIQLGPEDGPPVWIEWDEIRRARLSVDPWEQHRKGLNR